MTDPFDPEHGIREFACVDPNSTLDREGSSLGP